MKKQPKVVSPPKSNHSSSVSLDCTCQILYDTSLSNVSDSDCDCSECLEAHLDAFNQFKKQEEMTTHTIRQQQEENRRKATRSNEKRQQKQTKGQIARYRSTERLPHQETRTRKFKVTAEDNEQSEDRNFQEFKEGEGYTNGQLNDFLLITRHRTRKYMQERKKLAQSEQEEKDDLKYKIKKNLELLKYTTQMMGKNKQQNQVEQGKEGKPAHQYKWNHSIYVVHPKKVQQKEQKEQKKEHCKKIKLKKELKTDLDKLVPDFSGKRNEILAQRKRKRREQIERLQKQKCPHDQCPGHHNRTEHQKIAKIKRFIENNAKKYKQKKLKQKRNEQQKQKTRQAKLRAIQIKSKQMLGRAKKIDDDVSRTSFKLSIEHFDTFSELREENQKKKMIKQNRMAVKKAMKEGGALENKIYEDLDQQQDMDQKPIENVVLKRTVKGDQPKYREDADQELYERIAYDAKVKPPKNLKKKVEPADNIQPRASQTFKKQQKRAKNLSKTKQQEEKKRIQQEIDRKKKQILQEFKKRNSNAPSNKQIRKQYEEKVKQKNTTESRRVSNAQIINNTRDPYRTNYQTRAGKNANQVAIQGDPLLQQYTYHANKQAAKNPRGQNMEIFTQNIHSLSGQNRLKP